MVRGADFSQQTPAYFEARVKGKGKIDVYVNNLRETALVSHICDGKEWTTLSMKLLTVCTYLPKWPLFHS